MTFKAKNLGYREAARLAGFVLSVCAVGVPDDVVSCFCYDLKKDVPYIVTCDGRRYFGRLLHGSNNWVIDPDTEV